MITGHQIRAARAMLDWGADRLASETKLNKNTIHNIEKGATLARGDSLSKIMEVFASQGIEFLGDKGVMQKDEELVRLTGDNIFFKILDDVIATCQKMKDAEALFACVVDELSPPVVVENYRRLRATGIRMRSLIKEGDTFLMGKLDEYRQLPEKFFHNNPMIIYGNKVAFMVLNADTNTDKMAIVLSNPHTSAAMRNLFEFIWQHSEAPTKTTAEEHYE